MLCHARAPRGRARWRRWRSSRPGSARGGRAAWAPKMRTDSTTTPYTRKSSPTSSTPTSGAYSGRKMLNPAMPISVRGEDDAGPDRLGRDDATAFLVLAAAVRLRGGERHRRGQEAEPTGDVPDEVVVGTVEQELAEHRSERQPAPQRDRPVAHGFAAPLLRREVGGHRRGADEEARLAQPHEHARARSSHSSDSITPAHSAVAAHDQRAADHRGRVDRSGRRCGRRSGRSRIAPTASAPTASPTAMSSPPSACRRSAG